MSKQKAKNSIQNQSGMATIETMAILIIFLVLMSYTFGFFGSIHSGILGSIATRNYAFETFRHRANLVYFRDNTGSADHLENYYLRSQLRYHSTNAENSPQSKTWFASERPISMFLFTETETNSNSSVHNNQIPGMDPSRRNTTIEANPVWIKQSYGICINSACGG